MSKGTIIGIIAVVLGVFLFFYLVIVVLSANMTNSEASKRCVWVDGTWGGEKTGNYYVTNAWSLGTTGECFYKEKP